MVNRKGEAYNFTGMKGSGMIVNSTSELYKIKKNEQFMALSDEYFFNGEFWIKTSLGPIPSIFFYDGI